MAIASKPKRPAGAASAARAGRAKQASRDTAARDAERARRAVGVGGGVSLLGLAMVGVGEADSGAWVTLLGLLLLIYGIHTFGRLGPEETAAAKR